MAMEVIDRTQQVARLKYAQSAALGRGVEQAGFIIAQSISDYNKMLEHENNKKLAGMQVLIAKYGANKLGPDFMQQYETLTGIKLPRNDKGYIELPQTDDEKLQAMGMANLDKMSPQEKGDALNAYMGFASKPKSEREMQLEEMKVAIAKREADSMASYHATMAKAAMMRAEREGLGRGSARVQWANMGSGMMIDPNSPTGLGQWDGKGKELTQNEYTNMTSNKKLAQAAERIAFQDLDTHMKLDKAKFQQLQVFAGIMRKPGQLDEASVQTANAGFDTIMRSWGKDPEEIRRQPGLLNKTIDYIRSFTVDESSVPVAQANDQVKKVQEGSGSPLDAFDDEELKARFQRAMTEKHMSPADILADPKINNDPRAQKILQGMTNGR